MSEWRLFPEGQPPEWTTPEWYAERETAPHLEQEGHRERLILSARLANEVIDKRPGSVVIDFGAGDGGLLSLLRGDISAALGYDLQQTNVDAADARGETVLLRDVVATWPGSYERFTPNVALVTEMLEHLVDPHEFVQRLWDTPEISAVVASSPYTEDSTSHYDFHTWAWDLKGYRKLFEDKGWRVTAQETAWISQVIVVERP